jgi:hypothetical protein
VEKGRSPAPVYCGLCVVGLHAKYAYSRCFGASTDVNAIIIPEYKSSAMHNIVEEFIVGVHHMHGCHDAIRSNLEAVAILGCWVDTKMLTLLGSHQLTLPLVHPLTHHM